MISLSSILADVDGNVVFETLPSSTSNDTTRRVSRTKTLDGGCVIVDGGFSDSDRTLNIHVDYTAAILTKIQYLHENNTLIHIAIDDNFYSGVISSKVLTRGTQEIIKIQILIKEKLN